MDFEEQLEKAEKSPYPSLVGASVKSADDSPHNNYIHPEKYTGTHKYKSGKKSVLNSSIGASLDDLISEGALLGSDEDFDRFLDDKGNVLSDAKFTAEKSSDHTAVKSDNGSSLKNNVVSTLITDNAAALSPVDSAVDVTSQPATITPKGPAFESYSTPNLSEYQIGHQISDHSELIDSVKSYDLSRLPTSDDNESRSKTNVALPAADVSGKSVRPSYLRANSGIISHKSESGKDAQVLDTGSLHTPYFPSDERITSRSRSRVAFRDRSEERSRSRSRSLIAPHLARGDSYKNTHEVTPSKYELPADMKVEEGDEEETDDRETRQAKPKMGDSVAAAEASNVDIDHESVTRDPSLVTSGDYTNFNVDSHENTLGGSNLYSLRSQSSTNYLRSISRSRSRKPTQDAESYSSSREKNDANPHDLEREGALVSDDPYSQVDNLDSMLKNVLKGSIPKDSSTLKKSVEAAPSKTEGEASTDLAKTPQTPATIQNGSPTGKSIASTNLGSESETADVPVRDEASSTISKANVNDVSGEAKTDKTNKQLITEKAPTLSTDDIHTEKIVTKEPEDNIAYVDKVVKNDEGKTDKVNDVSAEEKINETHSHLIAENEPTVSSGDIHAKEPPKPVTAGSDQIENKDLEKNFVTPAIKDTNSKTSDEHDNKIKALEPKESSEKIAKEVNVSSEANTLGPNDKAVKESSATESKKSTLEKPESCTGESDKVLKANDTKAVNTKEASISSNSQEILSADAFASTKKAVKSETPKEEIEESFDVSPEEVRKHLESLPVYLYTSLAGGMQIITRTNRLTTILQANGIKFEYKDLGTDEEAKKLWRRYAQGKTLPGVVRGDDFIGNWEFIEEVNEDYRLKEVLHETF